MVFPSLNEKGRAKAPALYAVTAAGILILLSHIMYMLVLGPLVPRLTYPGYTTFSYIEVADFLERAEILFYTIFIAINIVEISISLYITAVCLASVFEFNNYRIFIIPLGFLVLEYSTFIVKNHAEHISIAMYSWPWYALIYQFFVPLLLLILSGVRKSRKQAS
jgi:spore germination protein KB